MSKKDAARHEVSRWLEEIEIYEKLLDMLADELAKVGDDCMHHDGLNDVTEELIVLGKTTRDWVVKVHVYALLYLIYDTGPEGGEPAMHRVRVFLAALRAMPSLKHRLA